MAGKRLWTLRTEREQLVDRWKNSSNEQKTKLLVQIMDLDEYIDKVMESEKQERRKINIH